MLDELQLKELQLDIIHDSIYDPGAIHIAKKYLGPEDFSDNRHREIFGIQLDLLKEGTDHTYLEIVERVDAKTCDYIRQLDSTLPGSVDHEAKCRKLREYLDDKRLTSKLRAVTNTIELTPYERLRKLEEVLKTENGIKNESQDTWQHYSLKDAYADRPPKEFIVHGVLETSSLSIVYAAPGHMKTFLLQDLATCVAAGLEWLEPLPNKRGAAIKTTQASVMWIDFDMGSSRTHERFEALARARDLEPDVPLVYYSMPSPWLDAGDLVQIIKLQERWRSMRQGCW
jgi:hypothetical protein